MEDMGTQTPPPSLPQRWGWSKAERDPLPPPSHDMGPSHDIPLGRVASVLRIPYKFDQGPRLCL